MAPYLGPCVAALTVSCLQLSLDCAHAFSSVRPSSSALGRRNARTSSIGTPTTAIASASTAEVDDSISWKSSIEGESKVNPSKENADPSIRPLHQNWWPVAFVNTLNQDAPNAERVLNRDLVLWHDGEEWRCMDDMCAHRFAPLSEGRVFVPGQDIGSGKLATNKFKKKSKSERRDNEKNEETKNKKRCLQCSYHGWEFNSEGTCTRIPQASDQSRALQTSSGTKQVNSYPVRIGGGMIWVWTDADTTPFAETIPLPISPMLKQWERQYPQSAYQRDLPYGYELLCENVIDASHLPFAHHDVLSDRDEAGVPLPFRMLSTLEKEQVWEKEVSSEFSNATDSADDRILPAFQVEIPQGKVQDADPIIAINFMGTNEGDENSTSYIGFYPPAHVRYHRTPKSNLASNTELFLCPQSAGKCRVMIFNPFEGGMEKLQEPPGEDNSVSTKKKQRLQLLAKLGSYILRKVILSKFLGTNNHLLTSDVFDGDTIFLAQQGERLAKNSLDHTDYLVPTSADTMTRKFRRWLDRSADATKRLTSSSISGASTSATPAQLDYMMEAAVGVSSDGTSPYTAVSQMSRRKLLDRYDSHTRSCPVCLNALANLERRKKILDCICPALFGMTGASLVAAALSTVLMDSAPVAKVAAKVSLKVLGASALLVALLEKIKRSTMSTIEKFHFVKHSHQD